MKKKIAFHHPISPDFIHFFHNALGEKHHNHAANSEVYTVKDTSLSTRAEIHTWDSED